MPDSQITGKDCDDKERMFDVRDKLPLPGQWVKLRHVIESEGCWDGEKFVLKIENPKSNVARITCNPKELEGFDNHTLHWKLTDAPQREDDEKPEV